MANATVPYVAKDGRLYIDVSANKTLLTTEFGWVQNIIADGVVLTLPASATVLGGPAIIMRNGGAAPTGTPVGAVSDASVGFVATPASGDGVTGNGFTAAANKGVTYVKASGKVGDEMTIESGGANTALAWNVTKVIGKLAAWTRTA